VSAGVPHAPGQVSLSRDLKCLFDVDFRVDFASVAKAHMAERFKLT